MLLYTTHIYTNTRKDGKVFFHEAKDKATDAAEPSKEEYESIAIHSSEDTRRCDSCLTDGKVSHALFHKGAGKDLCPRHREEFEKDQ